MSRGGEVIWADPGTGLEVRLESGMSPDFLAAVGEAWFGTGGLRYRRLDVAEQLGRLPGARFLELRRRDELIGTYVLARCDVHVGPRAVPGWYRGLLTIAEPQQGRGFGRLLAQVALDWVAGEARAAGEGLSWGCIEARNTRSLGLMRALGGDEWGRLEVSTVFRQWPRRRLELDRPGPADAAEVQAAVRETHADCIPAATPPADGTWIVLTRGSRIVAGARVLPTRVNMERIGGPWDLLYEGLLRHVPPARKRFDPRNFRYLRLGDVIVREGEQDAWRLLLSTLLAEHDAHMAMFVLDATSRASRLLADAGLFRRFSRIAREELRVVGFAWGGPGPGVAPRTSPLALGPLDL